VIVALVGAFTTIAALLAALVWIVGFVRADGRERAAALQLAEKLQGEINVSHTLASATIATLVADVRRATRRADALEEWARGRFAGAVDDGTDLLLAELSIVASGTSDDADGTATVSIRPPPGAGAPVSDRAPATGATTSGDGDADDYVSLPGREPP
jgi:hypothetical protein